MHFMKLRNSLNNVSTCTKKHKESRKLGQHLAKQKCNPPPKDYQNSDVTTVSHLVGNGKKVRTRVTWLTVTVL